MVQTVDSAVQRLLDKQEIHEALMRYSRGVDRLDEAMIASAFHADAVTVYGASVQSPAELAAGFIPRHRDSYKCHMHCITNEFVEIEGDTAFSEAYVVAHLRHGRDGRDGREYDFVFGGRYVDRFERRHGVWKIAHRVVVHEWDRVDPVGETNPSCAAFVHGIRSREDLIYKR